MSFKSITPANEPCKIDRVVKDLFGAKKIRLNNAQTGIFLGKTKMVENYSLRGTKKRLKAPAKIFVNTDILFTKAMQSRELNQPTAYQGLSVHEVVYWGELGQFYYREEAAKAKANAKANAKAAAAAAAAAAAEAKAS